jgi:hypothetical protein
VNAAKLIPDLGYAFVHGGCAAHPVDDGSVVVQLVEEVGRFRGVATDASRDAPHTAPSGEREAHLSVVDPEGDELAGA